MTAPGNRSITPAANRYQSVIGRLDDRGMRCTSRTTFRSFALVGTLISGMAVARPAPAAARDVSTL